MFLSGASWLTAEPERAGDHRSWDSNNMRTTGPLETYLSITYRRPEEVNFVQNQVVSVSTSTTEITEATEKILIFWLGALGVLGQFSTRPG